MISPLPMEFVKDGDTITMRLEEYDTVRTIHMNPKAVAPAAHTLHGFSRGRWEGTTLVVETDHLAAGYFDHEGTPQSDQIRTVERFVPSADYRRIDYTLSTVLTLQLYVQPFVSKGTYSSIRELADPRAAAFDDRYKPYADTAVTNHPGSFNVKQFNSTVVLRWEYRPGSTLFLVWTQGRGGRAALEGTRSLAGDFRDTFDLHPVNTFLVKASYWLNW